MFGDSVERGFEVAGLSAIKSRGNFGLKLIRDKNHVLTGYNLRLLFYKGFVHCRTIYLIFRDIPFKWITGIHSNKFTQNILTKGLHWYELHIICPWTFWGFLICFWLYFIVLKWFSSDISRNKIFWNFFNAWSLMIKWRNYARLGT